MGTPPLLHSTEQVLRAYNLGQLEEAAAGSVRQHLESCPDCRRRLANLASESSLGRQGGSQSRPDSPAPLGSTFAGLSGSEGASRRVAPAEAIPPELADHPDYQIIGELGRGGMGVVYLAQNTLMGRKEVLKVVSRDLMSRRTISERFLREIRNAAQLHHPNIVTAYAAMRAGESIVLAMEYVEGYDLAKLVKDRGPLAVAHACHFVAQAAQGLQHAHETGMVHRDIKPGNLMLSLQGKRGVVKILDFGLAKATQETPIDGGLTREGQMLGTPDYIAPEQTLDAQKADIRADIYSLGCTLYYLLTGGPPFRGSSLYEILQAHHAREAAPLDRVRPDVPAELAAVVGRMMAKEPERRFQTPAEVARALKPFCKSGVAGAPAATVAKPQVEPPPLPPRPARDRTPAPATQARMLVGQKAPAPEWKTLIEVRPEAVPAREAAALPEPGRVGRPWLWPSATVGVLLLGVTVGWGLHGSPGNTKSTAREPGPPVESRPVPKTEPLFTATQKAPVVARDRGLEPSPAPEPKSPERVSTIRPPAGPNRAGAQPALTNPPEPPKEARPARTAHGPLAVVNVAKPQPVASLFTTNPFDVSRLARKPIQTKDTLEQILAAPGSYADQVVVPAGMYHLVRSRVDRYGPRKYFVSEQKFEWKPPRGPLQLVSSASTSLELEPGLAQHLDRLAAREREGKEAILTLWVARSGDCGIVKVEILQLVRPRFHKGYKHKPYVGYETLEVTPEGTKAVESPDWEWEQPERYLSLASSYKRNVRAQQVMWKNHTDAQIQRQMNNLWGAAMQSVIRGEQQRQMFERGVGGR